MVANGVKSKGHRIFSGVPQGGKWSAPLWDFEISTLQDLDIYGLLISYADDCSLLYEVTDQNREILIDDINGDLQKLEEWGVLWHVSFAPDKTHSLLVSRRHSPFDISGIHFRLCKLESVFIVTSSVTFQPQSHFRCSGVQSFLLWPKRAYRGIPLLLSAHRYLWPH